MRWKQLESALSSVQREFPNPNVTLEQYPTSPQLTAAVVMTALNRQDIGPGRSVLDLGCGTAMLSIGCALVGSDFVWGVDCDETALTRAKCNIREAEVDDRISLIQARVGGRSKSTGETRQGTSGNRGGRRATGRGGRGKGYRGGKGQPQNPSTQHTVRNSDGAVGGLDAQDTSSERAVFPMSDQCVDTVVTNPPFGTKPDKAGIDMEFLSLACRLATRSVYSFHKTTTRDYVLRTIQAHPLVASATVIAEMKFDIPQTYKFHQKASVDVAVDLIRVELIHVGESVSTGLQSVNVDGGAAEIDRSLGQQEDSDNDSEQFNGL